MKIRRKRLDSTTTTTSSSNTTARGNTILYFLALLMGSGWILHVTNNYSCYILHEPSTSSSVSTTIATATNTTSLDTTIMLQREELEPTITPIPRNNKDKDKDNTGYTLPIHEEEECFSLANYSTQKVVRVDLQKFMQQGPGAPYLPLFAYMRNQSRHADPTKIESEIFMKMPEINLGSPPNFKKDQFKRCDMLFQHNYKAGGTTVIYSKLFRARIPTRELKWVELTQQRRQSQLQSQLRATTTNNNNEPKTFRDHNNQRPPQLLLPPPRYRQRVSAFTLLRDPVPRFVSAVSQITKMGGLGRNLCHSSKHWHALSLVKNRQFHPTTYLQCVLDTMQDEISYLNIHLLPQAFNLYNQHDGHHIQLDFVDLTDLGPVLEGMGVADVSNITGNVLTSTDVFGNGTALLTADMIRTVCRLYQIDVELLHVAEGVTKTMCDEPQYQLHKHGNGDGDGDDDDDEDELRIVEEQQRRWIPEEANDFFLKEMWSQPKPPPRSQYY